MTAADFHALLHFPDPDWEVLRRLLAMEERQAARQQAPGPGKGCRAAERPADAVAAIVEHPAG